MINKSLFSSKNNEWETPDKLFHILNEVFEFDLDLAATKKNTKCEKYYTIDDNALTKKWSDRCWLNPPYGKEIKGFMNKAAIFSGKTLVCLVPARTDTQWFHNCIKNVSSICFLKGRVKFFNPNVKKSTSAPFPSMLLIFGSNVRKHHLKYYLTDLGLWATPY